MVLVRTLLSAPTAVALLPTRQLLSQWRCSLIAVANLYCPSARWTSPISAPIGKANLVFDGYTNRFRKVQLQSSPFCTTANFERTLTWGGWPEEARAQVKCVRSNLPSSREELSIEFSVTLEENTTLDAATQVAVDRLEVDGRLALKLAIEDMKDLGNTDIVELSLLICNDAFIQDLNSKWLGKNRPTDVLSFPQDQPPGLTPHLLLGDVIISVETAARQAEERGHKLLDELRILLVHGLLHVLGHDHELGQEASKEMEEKETQILSKLGWLGKGLINASFQSNPDDIPEINGGLESAGIMLDEPKNGGNRRFKILFCDMDGTLLNCKSRVTEASGDALKAAMRNGVQVVIATGKTQYGAMAALRAVGLTGEGGVISTTSPGVFAQGLQVYGRGGAVIHSACLHQDLVREAFSYSIEHNLPAVGFCGNRCVTVFQHQATEDLHYVYMEPKAEVISSIDDLIASCKVQKIVFISTAEFVKFNLRPHWALQTQGRATLVQAQEDMLEILPMGQSKGAGVMMLLDHLGISRHEMMAIGDGENDVEMLELAGWSVAMENGTDRAKAVANVLTGSNNNDGVAQAIHRYILS